MADVSIEEKVGELFSGEAEVPDEEVITAPVPEFADEVAEETEKVDEVADEVTEEVTDEVKVEEPESVEVEFDGILYDVPVALKDSLLRQSDYTVKTQEVALSKKEFEVQTEQIVLERNQYEFAQSVFDEVLEIRNLDSQAEQWKDYIRSNVDNMSPLDIEKARMSREELIEKRDKLSNEIRTKQVNYQQAQDQSQAEILKKGTEVLKQKIPDWGPEKEKEVQNFALSLGYPPSQLQNVTPMDVVVLHGYMQYQALLENKTKAVKKVQSAPKIKTSSRDPMPEDVKRKLNLRKRLKNPKRSSKDKARDIQAEMAERFG